MTNSLRDKAASGAIWKTIERIVSQAVHFGLGIVLARLLNPSDFGIIGMLAIFIAIANTLQDCGFGSALIQNKSRTQSDFSTAFYFNIISSIAIYFLLFFSAPIIANFYAMPLLKDVTRVLSISVILNGLVGVQMAKLNIEFRFRFISIISIIGQIVTGVVGIVLAYRGFGVWALVYQSLAASAIVALIIWVSAQWHPSLTFSKQSFKKLFSFGGNMLGVGIINVIYSNLYTIVIGKFFSPTLVGMYNRANSYANLPASFVMDMAVRVNFPILASIQDDDERLLRAYKKLLRVPFFILYPILVGIIILAKPLIILMIGEKWLPCVPMLQLLCIGSMFSPLNAINSNLLYVKGRSDLSLRLEFIKKPLGLIFLFALIPAGIYWLIAGRALYSVLVYAINCYYTKRILNYGLWEQIKILIPILLQVAAMATACYLSISYIESNIAQLITGSIVSIVVYMGISVIRKDESLYDILTLLRERLKKGKTEQKDA